MAIADAVLSRVPGFRALRAQALSADLASFFRSAWDIVNPGKRLVWSWHYDYLCEHLTLVKQRKLRRLIINVPPRTAKSTLVSICWPVHWWLTSPNDSFLAGSYSMDLATDHSAARRALITSPWFQRLFADRFTLSGDRNLVSAFGNDKRGAMVACSVGSRALGYGFSGCGILDDPMSATDALSDSSRAAANHWLTHTFMTRADNPAESGIVLVMQRLHERDSTAFLLDGDEAGTWVHLKIPLRQEQDQLYTFPISGRTVLRKAGDILMPSRYPPKLVRELEARRLEWASQYQMEPAPVEGNLIRRSEVKYWGGIDHATGVPDEPLPTSFDLVLVSVDCAFKAEVGVHDKVGLLAIGVKDRRRFILTIRNRNLSFADTEAEIRWLREKHNAGVVLVEDKANGSAIIERLKANVPGVIAINPMGGKEARMFAASVEWQAGDWFVPRGDSNAEEFVQQITLFPRARWNDLCDAMSQSAIWLQAHPPGGEGAVVAFLSHEPTPGLVAALRHGDPVNSCGLTVTPEVGLALTGEQSRPLTDVEEWSLITPPEAQE